MSNHRGIKITFLGTGTSQGIPVIACHCRVCTSTHAKDKRLRCSLLIESATTTLVIDAGPDFRQQMLREKVEKLDAVVLTHEHKDHIGGIDDVRAFNFKQQKDMEVYCTSRVEEALRKEISYAFDEIKYPGVPQIQVKLIDKKTPFRIGDIELQPIEVMHHKLPVLGFRIFNFTYITDANAIHEEEFQKIKGSDILVLNALKYEEHISHFTVGEAVEIMETIHPRQGYLTHMSHNIGLHAEEEKKLPDFIRFAYDGLKIEI